MTSPEDNEAAALEYAKQRVGWFRTHAVDMDGVPTNLFDPLDSERRAVGTLALALLEGEFPREYAWQQARAGEPLFVEALHLIAANEFEDKYRTLEPLRGYVADLLRNRPRVRVGRRRESYYYRDSLICSFVQETCDRFGLHPTGQPGKPSACKVVGDALGMEPDTVRKVWNARKSRGK